MAVRFAVLLGFTLPSSESSADQRGLLWSTAEIRSMRSPFRSALRGDRGFRVFGGRPARLLRCYYGLC